MNNKTINKVRVIKDFPGYKEGDVLQLDPNTGLFEAIFESGFDVLINNIEGADRKSLSKKEVVLYIGTLFEDISEYKVRSFRELERRVDELKANIEALKGNESFTNLNKDEAIIVWQNMLWEYEWIMGMRDLYFGNVNAEISQIKDKKEFLPMDDLDVVDGNKLEEEHESTDTDEVRQDS